MLRIGRLKLHSNLILAPMAGVSDLAFRMINRKFGAQLAFVEMINCRSISFKSKKTQKMLSSSKEDQPLGVQLLGLEPEFISRAMDVLAGYSFDLIDFNAACPAKKVVRRGEGAGLLKDLKMLSQLLKIMVKKTAAPVSIKIRTGWDRDSLNAEVTAKIAQDAGASAVFIHGRTKMQGYSGAVDYSSIGRVKKSLKIPVIASGDIFSGNLAKKMFDQTGCDGIAIARGALGNPWIFDEIREYLKNGLALKRPAGEEVAQVMLLHLSMCVDLYGEKNGVIIFRKFFSWYTKGFRRIRRLREQASRISSRQQMQAAIRSCAELKKNY